MHEVSTRYWYKSDRARFMKKKSWGRKWGKTPIFGAFLMFFVHISKTALRILTKFCIWTVLIDTYHLAKTACPRKIWFDLYSSGQTPFFVMQWSEQLKIWTRCTLRSYLKMNNFFSNFFFNFFLKKKLKKKKLKKEFSTNSFQFFFEKKIQKKIPPQK